MAFPQEKLDILSELYLGGWRDITSRVRASAQIKINRGQPPESSGFQYSRADFTINNRNGDFSPPNPTSPWYGYLGRNTPSRTSVVKLRDAFDRTVVNGWGTSPTAGAWTLHTNGSDFAVSSGIATQSVNGTNTWREAHLADVTYADIDVMVTWSYDTTNVTGGNLEPGNAMLRVASATSYYIARVEITTAEAIQISIHSFADGQLAAPVVVAGLTHSANTQFTTRFSAEGQTLRAKVWLASDPEPYAWQVTAHHSGIASGGVGVRTGVALGNTNTKPIVVSYSDFQAIQVRASVEISEWPPEWDTSGQDIYTPVEGSGLLRRLAQGAKPLPSVLRRTLPTAQGLVAYWPCEDGSSAIGVASGISSGQIMAVNGTPNFASYSGFAASAPMLTLNNAWLPAWVTGYASTGSVQFRFLMHVPDSGDTDGSVIAGLWSNGGGGTAVYWEIIYHTGGKIRLKVWDNPYTSSIYDSGQLTANLNGRNLLVHLQVQNNGSNVDWLLATLEVGASVGDTWFDTLTGYQVGSAAAVALNPALPNKLSGTAIGHVTVQNVITSIFDFKDQLKAYLGETAGTRIQRLCSEQGVPFEYVGDLTTTARMGAQTAITLLELLAACVLADLGTLYETRGVLGLAYRTRAADYNQTAKVTLDYSLKHLLKLKPATDDQLLRNDVTVTRVNGSSFHIEQSTGPLAVTEPQSGGVGRYARPETVVLESDLQLPDVAGWLLHLGTVDDERYPVIGLDLARSVIVSTSGLADAITDLSIGDRLVINNPKAGQRPDPISQLVRSYQETLAQFTYELTFSGVPERPYQVLRLDSATLGPLGSITATLAGTMTTTATSVQVADTGRIWTTTDLPLSIMVTGEKMTVTAVSGASSPQTFTVTRSVNGVVKTHSSGEQVQLYRPAYLAA